MEEGSPQQKFIQDVIHFIDQPLSPRTLHDLRKSCKHQPGYKDKESRREESMAAVSSPPARQDSPSIRSPSMVDMHRDLPMGTEIEAYNLQNTTEFNGLKGHVVGYQGDKVLVEFFGGGGQVFDIPPANLRVVRRQGSASWTPSVKPEPAPVASPPHPESAALQERLRCGMSHVEAAHDAMETATRLSIVDPEGLYTVIAEFQPTLSRSNIIRNWRKIIQIYQAHAERVERSVSQQSPQARGLADYPSTALGTNASEDIIGQLEGVISFLDA
eukprot:Sspe_Gene.7829::Locus_2654_Transcript_1_3_Confidence_0.400_Length_1022::g.7829::m.7829